MKRVTITVTVGLIQYDDGKLHYNVIFQDGHKGVASFRPHTFEDTAKYVGLAILTEALG